MCPRLEIFSELTVVLLFKNVVGIGYIQQCEDYSAEDDVNQ